MYSKADIVEAIYQSFPYSDQCHTLDIESEADAVRFTWRGNRFRISDTGRADEVGNSTLTGSDLAILAGQIVKTRLIQNFMSKPKAA